MKKPALLFILFTVLSVACSKNESTEPLQVKLTLADLNSMTGEYSFSGYAVSKTPSAVKTSLKIIGTEAGRLRFSGQSYVNLFGGSYTFDESAGALSLHELMTTEMAALDESQNQAEQEFYRNFGKVKKCAFDGKTLRLFDTDPASETMIFVKK